MKIRLKWQLGPQQYPRKLVANRRDNKIAHQAEMKIATDNHFFALNPHCIAAHIADQCGIPAIQMEFNWRDLKISKGNSHGYRKIYYFLKDIGALL